MPQCPLCLSVLTDFYAHTCPGELPEARRSAAACSPSFSATPRTDAFCASLKGVGNWECWQKTASFAADLERELATVRRDLQDLMEEYADRRAQWGDEYLWRKHEDTELVEDICRRLLENVPVVARAEQPTNTESE